MVERENEKESFLWHAVSESEKQSIQKEAKQIMDKFAKSLAEVENKISDKDAGFVQPIEKDMRSEGEGQEPDSKFRQIMFENAPAKSKDCVVAEKGKWK